MIVKLPEITVKWASVVQEPEFWVIGVNFVQVKRNLVQFSRKFELSEFQLSELEFIE